jgi:hypothetical protein
LALATIPISAINWLITVLRLSGQLTAITVSNGVYAVSICGLSWFLAPHGLTMIGASWLLGSSIAVLVAGAAVVRGARRGALEGTVQGGLADAVVLAAVADAPTTWANGAPLVGVTIDRPLDVEGDESEADGSEADGGRRWWPFVVAVAAVLVGASLVSPSGRHQWDVSIFRQPDNYTTLSFEGPAHLPSAAPSGTPVDLAFAVGNKEGHRVVYSYIVTSANADAGAGVVLEHSTVAVSANHTRVVRITVVPQCTTASCRVTITLPSETESIDALISVQGATK